MQMVIEATRKAQSRGRGQETCVGVERCNGAILDKVARIITKKVAL